MQAISTMQRDTCCVSSRRLLSPVLRTLRSKNGMIVMHEIGKRCLLCLAVMGSTGCSRAPSVEVIGSFFPAWMFCIVAALISTDLIRLELVRRGLEKKLGPLIVLYPSIAVAISCLLWLILFA